MAKCETPGCCVWNYSLRFPYRPLECTVAPSISRPPRVKKHLLPGRTHLVIFLHLHRAVTYGAPVFVRAVKRGPATVSSLSALRRRRLNQRGFNLTWSFFGFGASGPGRRLINIYPRWQDALCQVDQRSRLDVNCGDAGVSISSMTCTNSRIQGFILTNGSF